MPTSPLLNLVIFFFSTAGLFIAATWFATDRRTSIARWFIPLIVLSSMPSLALALSHWFGWREDLAAAYGPLAWLVVPMMVGAVGALAELGWLRRVARGLVVVALVPTILGWLVASNPVLHTTTFAEASGLWSQLVRIAVITGVTLLLGIWLIKRSLPNLEASIILVVMLVLSQFIAFLPIQGSYLPGHVLLLTLLVIVTGIGIVFINVSDRYVSLLSQLLQTVPLRGKFILSFTLIFSLAIAVSLISGLSLLNLNRDVQNTLATQNRLLALSNELVQQYREARRYDRDYSLTARTKGITAAQAESFFRWQQTVAAMPPTLEEARTLARIGGIQPSTVEGIARAADTYVAQGEQLFDLYDERGDRTHGAVRHWIEVVKGLDLFVAQDPNTVRPFDSVLRLLRTNQFNYIITQDTITEAVISANYQQMQEAVQSSDWQVPADVRAEYQSRVAEESAAFAEVSRLSRQIGEQDRALTLTSLEVESALSEFSQEATATFDQTRQQIALQQFVSMGLIILALLAGMLLAYLLVRLNTAQIETPLLTLTEAADRLAEGDLDAQVTVTNRDELGRLARTFNTMAERVRASVTDLEARVVERTEQIETAANVAAAASQQRDLDELLNSSVTLITERFRDIYHAQIFLNDAADEWAELRASTGEAGQTLLAQKHRLAVGSRSVVGQVTQSGNHMLSRTADPYSIHRPNPLLPDTKSELTLPMRFQDRVIGALDVQSKLHYAFTEDEVSALQTMADQLSIAIQNARYVATLGTALAESELLFDFTNRLLGARARPEVSEILMRVAEQYHPDIDRLTVAFVEQVDSDGLPLRLYLSQSWEQGKGIGAATNRREEALALRALFQGPLGDKPLFLPHVTESDVGTAAYRSLHATELKSLGFLPLVLDNALIGLILLQRKAALPFSDATVRIFRSLAQQATLALSRFMLLEEMEQRVVELEEMRAHFLGLGETTEYNELLGRIVETAADMLGANGADLYIREPNQPAFTLRATHNLDMPLGIEIQPGEGAVGQLILNPLPLLIEDYPASPYRSDQFRSVPDIQSVLATPLVADGEVFGALSVFHSHGQAPFDQDDLRRLALFSDQVAMLLRNSQLAAVSGRAAAQLSTAAEVGRATSSQLNIGQLLNEAVALIKERFSLYHTQVFLLDPSKKAAILRASSGEIGRVLLERHHSLPVGSRSVIGLTTASGTHTLARAVEIDPDTIHRGNPMLPETRTELALPMRTGDEIIGALDVQSTDPTAFSDPTEIASLQTLADQLSVAIQNARLFGRAQAAVSEAELLYNASRSVNEAMSLDDLGRLLEEIAAATATVDQLLLFRYTPTGDESYPVTLTRIGFWDAADGPPPSEGSVLFSASSVESLRARLFGKTSLLEDFELFREQVPELYGYLANQEAKQMLLAPLRGANMELGVMAVIARSVPELSTTAQRLFSVIAPQLGNALGRFYLLDTMMQRVEDLESLRQSFLELTVTESREELQKTLVVRAAELMGGRPTAFYGVTPAGLALTTAHRVPEDAPWALPHAVSSPQSDLRVTENMTLPTSNGRPLPAILTPLLYKNRLLGAFMVVQTPGNPPLNDNDLRRLALFADQASLAIQNTDSLGAYQKAADRMMTAAEVSDSLLGRRQLQEILQDTLNLIRERFGFYYAQVLLIDQAFEQAVLVAGTGEVGETMLARRHRLPVGSESVVGQASATKRAVMAQAGVQGTIHRFNPLLPDTRSEMALPMVSGETVIGVLDVQSTDADAFADAADREVLQTLANQLAVVVENTRLFDEAEQSVQENQALYQASQRVGAATDLHEILLALYELLSPSLNRLGLLTMSVDSHGGGTLETIGAISSDAPEQLESGRLFPFPPPFPDIAKQLQSQPPGTPLLVANTQSGSLPDNLRAYYRTLGLVSVALLPMGTIQGRTWFLHLSRTTLHPFTEQDVLLLRRIVPQVVVSIQKLQLVENLEQRAARLNRANDMANRLLAATSAATLAKVATEDTLQLVDAHHALLTLYDDANDRATFVAHATHDGSPTDEVGQTFSLSQSSIASQYRKGTSYLKFDRGNETAIPEAVRTAMLGRRQGIFLGAPIWLRDQLLGTLSVTRDETHASREWTESDIAMLQNAATIVAAALDNERLLNRLQTRASDLTALNESIGRMVAAPTVAAVLRQAAHDYVAIADVDQCGILMLSADRTTAEVAAQYNPTGETVTGSVLDVRGNEVIQWIDAHRRPFVVDNLATDERMAQTRDFLMAQGVRSLLIMPLVARNRLIGTIGLDKFTLHKWGVDEIERAATMSNALSSAIEHLRLLDEMDATLRQTQRLYSASRAINAATTFDEVTKAISLYGLEDEKAATLIMSLTLDANKRVRAGTVEGLYLPNVKETLTPAHRERLAHHYLASTLSLNLSSDSLFVEDVESHPGIDTKTRRYLRRLNVGALLSVPLHLPTGWTGILIVSFPDARPLTKADQTRLSALAAQAATAIQNLSLLERTSTSLRESQLLYQAGAEINEATDYESLLEALTPLAARFDPDQTILALFEEPASIKETVIRFNTLASITHRYLLVPPGASIRLADFPLLNRLPLSDPIVFEDIHNSTQISPEERFVLGSFGLGAMMYFPLRVGMHYLGWIGFNASGPRQVDASLVGPLQAIMQQVAVAIQRQQLLEEAQRQALQDEHIARITARLYSTIDPEEIMRIGIQELKQTLRLRRASVWTEEESDAPPVSLS